MFMTLEEVSIYLKVSKSTIYNLIKREELPSIKVGSQWRFKKETIDRWMNKIEKNKLSNSENQLR